MKAVQLQSESRHCMNVGGEPHTPATLPPGQSAPVPIEQDAWGLTVLRKKKISCPQRKSYTGPSDPQRGHTTPTASELHTCNSNTGTTVTELTVSTVHTITQCVRK